MTNIVENVEHEVSVEDLLRQIISRLDLLLRYNEEITGEKFREEDTINDSY